MNSNTILFIILALTEFTIIFSFVCIAIMFKLISNEIKNTRSDYNFRQAKLQELFEGKNEINQLIVGQYKLILEQYQDILQYWKKSTEIVMKISEQYETLEGRYSDIYEEYKQLNDRIEDLANALEPEEIDLDEASSFYFDPFYDRDFQNPYGDSAGKEKKNES